MIFWYAILGVAVYVGEDFTSAGSPAYMAVGALFFAIAAAMAVWTVLSWLRWRRHGIPRLRRELARMIAERAGAAWVNRDEHLLFIPDVQGRGPACRRFLVRADEDQARDVWEAGDGEVVAVTGEVFSVAAGEPGFGWRVMGARMTPGPDGRPVQVPWPAGKETLRGAWLGWQAGRAGQASAAGELAEVIRQFRAAEPAARDGEA